jgi:hypothetical protein
VTMSLRFLGGVLVDRETGEILFDPRAARERVAANPCATACRVIDWGRLAEAGAFAVRRARAKGWLDPSLDDETRAHLSNWFSYWGWALPEAERLTVKERLAA